MAISHVYSQTVADGTATSVVRPSDWNSAHNQYMTIGSNTAGVSTLSGTNIQFNGGNNLTLSANGNTLIFSAANQTVDTNKAGTGFSSTTTAGTAIVGTNNTNGLSLGVPAFLTTYAAQSNQTGNLYVTAGSTQLSSTAGVDLRSISFAGAGIASVGVSNGVVLVSVPSGGGAGDGVNIIRAGTVGTTGTTFSASTGTININGGNNITVSQDGSNNIVISAAQGGIAAGTQTATSGTLVFANSNGVTFGMSGSSQITASVNVGGGAQTGISSVAVSDTVYTSGQISFRDGNNISFASGTGQAVSITHNLQSAGAYLTTARASNDAIGLNTALTANGLSVTANSSGLSINVPAWLTTAAQSNHSHNFATTTTNGSLMVVATTNSAGATVAVPPYITTYAAQSNQTANFYVSGNSTQLSSTAGIDLRSVSFEGAGVASVGVSNGRVLISVPSGGGAGDGYNIVYAGTAGTTGTTWSSASASVRINGGNNITVSQNGSNDIVISAAQGGIAAGTQTATSGTLVFANSNGVTFGMSGSSQITASVNAGGGAGYTALTMQNRQLGASTTLNSAGGQNSLWLAPVRVAAPVSASTILAAMISYSGTITSAATAQVGQTLRVGIWSQLTDPASTSRFDTWWTGAASITAWNSGTSSVSYNFSLAGGATTSSSAGSNLLTANFMGERQIIIPIGSTMQTGLYVFGILNSTSSAGYSAAMSRIALYMDNPLSLGMGTIGQATNASNGYVDGGTYLTTTGALPNTLALNQIGVVNNVMPYFKVGAI